MFGFGKKSKKTTDPKANEIVSYTMGTIIDMTRLDPTLMPNEARDAILVNVLKQGCAENKFDFCAVYMIQFAAILHGAQNQEGSDRVFQACASFISQNKEKMTEEFYNKIYAVIQLGAPK